MDFFQLNAGALAYLGDSVLEALIREALILKGFEKSAHLNKEALKYVTAVNQCCAFSRIENILTYRKLSLVSSLSLSLFIIALFYVFLTNGS